MKNSQALADAVYAGGQIAKSIGSSAKVAWFEVSDWIQRNPGKMLAIYVIQTLLTWIF
jgi:hypothetical protein